jgi:hypothetical protein
MTMGSRLRTRARQQRTWLTLADNIESEKLAASQKPDVDFLDEFSYSFLSLNRGYPR